MARMSDHARARFDARGKVPPERLSEYFDFTRWPEKAGKPVTRHELLVILTQMKRGEEGQKWYVRLWRWLKRPVNSGPTPLAPATEAAIEAREAIEEKAKQDAERAD